MQIEWTDMAHYQQQLQKVVRALLPARQSTLTASECELLARLYLNPGQNNPFPAQRGERHEEGSGEPLPEVAL